MSKPTTDSLRLLFTEGASTSARHSLFALGGRHTIDLCDPQRLCLGRFSRFVRRFDRCPSFVRDPAAYLDFLLTRLRAERYDVLFPVHDQVFLLARFRKSLARLTGLAVPPFESVRRLQSKADFARLLTELDLPQPETQIGRAPEDLVPPGFPCYVKRAYSTASRGVWAVADERQWQTLMTQLRAEGQFDGRRETLVQRPARGELCVTQLVFQQGRLVGGHCYRTVARGAAHAPCVRESVSHPQVFDNVRRLGRHLDWHGAIHVEYFHDPESGAVSFIEANPRIGETLNATCAGVNLCERLVAVSRGERLDDCLTSRPGVRTHSLLLAVLGAAQHGRGRRGVLRELLAARRGRGDYAGSREELCRPREDAWSLVPTAWKTLQLLLAPGVADRTVHQAAATVALSEESIVRIEALPESACAG